MSYLTYTQFHFKRSIFCSTPGRPVPESKLLIIVVVILFTDPKNEITSFRDILPFLLIGHPPQPINYLIYFILLPSQFNSKAFAAQPWVMTRTLRSTGVWYWMYVLEVKQVCQCLYILLSCGLTKWLLKKIFGWFLNGDFLDPFQFHSWHLSHNVGLLNAGCVCYIALW